MAPARMIFPHELLFCWKATAVLGSVGVVMMAVVIMGRDDAPAEEQGCFPAISLSLDTLRHHFKFFGSLDVHDFERSAGKCGVTFEQKCQRSVETFSITALCATKHDGGGHILSKTTTAAAASLSYSISHHTEATMLRPGKSNNGLPSHSGGGYPYNGGYNNGGGASYGGYSGYPDTGYSSSSSTPLYSPRRSSTESPFLKLLKNKWLWTLLLCVILLCSTLHFRGKYKATLKKLNVKTVDEAVRLLQDAERDKQRQRKDNQVNTHAQEQYKKKIEKLVDENRSLRKEKDELRIRYEGQGVDKQSATREKAMQHQIQLLQNATKRESKRAVLERFGQGPHHVKFTLKMPDDTLNEMIVEMAPLDLVPHAIHLFLEQVSHQLWDGTHFYLNGPHVTQAGPQDYKGDPEERSAIQRFVDMKLDKLAFPDYSPDFPHEPFVSLCSIV